MNAVGESMPHSAMRCVKSPLQVEAGENAPMDRRMEELGVVSMSSHPSSKSCRCWGEAVADEGLRSCCCSEPAAVVPPTCLLCRRRGRTNSASSRVFAMTIAVNMTA